MPEDDYCIICGIIILVFQPTRAGVGIILIIDTDVKYIIMLHNIYRDQGTDIGEAWNDEERSKKSRFSLQGIFKGGEPIPEEDIDEAIKEDDNGNDIDN